MEQLSKPRVLLLLAHPDRKASQANQALIESVKNVRGIRIVDLYEYAGKPYDLAEFRELVSGAESLIFQFPFYWASAPSEMKRWIDEVFTTLAHEGAVKGKKLMVATTAASEFSAYRSGGRNRFTMDELLRPYQMTANHAGMVWQTPFVVYGLAGTEGKQNLQEGVEAYPRVIAGLME